MTARRSPRTISSSPETRASGLSRRAAIAIALTALAVRLVHLWQMRDTVFFTALMGDARGYDAWARQLAAGDWVGREVFYQAPLYPYFLGAVYALVGRDLLVVRLVQAALGAVSAIALGQAASRLFGAAAGLTAGMMLALYPPAIFFDGLLQKSVLDVLLVCVSLAVAARIVAGGEARWWLVLGLAMGALSLTRENALVLVAVAMVWALVDPRARGSRVSRAGLLLAGLAVVLAPVAARNYAVGGGLYLTTSQFGPNLFIGNNPRADGSYVSLRAGRGSPEFERLDATTLAQEAVGRTLTPGEVSRYWTGRTLHFIRDEPAAWMRLTVRKAWLLWNANELVDTESQESHEEYSTPLGVLGSLWHFGVLAPLAVVGIWIAWPERGRLWPIHAFGAAYAASVVLFFVVARYRLPLVPFAMIFAAVAVVRARALAAGVRRRLASAAVLAALVAVVSNWPVYSADASRAITENNLGTALQEDGRPSDALAHYRRALELDPHYSPALNNLGTALRAAGRADEALRVYERALATSGDVASVHFNMGNALMAQGDAGGAAAHFRQAIAAAPRFAEAYNNLGQALAAMGQGADAIAAFRQAVAIDDRSALAHANLGNALASSGVLSEAAAELRRAIAIAPDEAGAYYDLGSVLLEAGAYGDAASALGTSVRLRPESAEAHNNLGIAFAAQGRMAEAVAHWKEAVRLKPGFADALKNLERAGQ
jgi:tetratricopeptide (TPR) repeat protein